ncbi:hypothetical protein [Burkholderia sp. MS455]|uniref:hypothetical protein n=1 Tax=Burkholderia sp. MS455 TaxID=2811788 RepID=UPI001EF626F9|nr:hypothetical protein [Burkholderia sp. MS455]
MQPNVSIAAVALHYRLSANLLRRWVAARDLRANSVPSVDDQEMHRCDEPAARRIR